MSWFLLIGVVLTGWTMLLVLSGERQRRMIEIDAKRQQAQAALKAQQENQQDVPVLG